MTTTIAPTTTAAPAVATEGLTLNVLRFRTDCTNGGISATTDNLTLVGHLPEDFRNGSPVVPLPKRSRCRASADQTPAVALEIRHIGEHQRLSLVPVTWDAHAGQWVRTYAWTMAGGNYATTSDSRFGEWMEQVTGLRFPGAIDIHDRVEW